MPPSAAKMPTASATSYGQVIEYVQGRYSQFLILRMPLRSYTALYQTAQLRRTHPLTVATQIVSTSHHIRVHQMNQLHSHILLQPLDHRTKGLRNRKQDLHPSHQAHESTRLSTSLSTKLYSTTAFMPTSALYISDTSTVLLFNSTK